MNGLYLLAFACFALALAFGVIWWLGRREGQAGAERDQAQAGVDHAKRANEIREDVRGLSDDDLARELRDGQ